MSDETTMATPKLGADLLERSTRVIDLSIEIYEGMPIWPGHQLPYMFVNQDHEGFKKRWGGDIGFEAHNWLISEHTGTHTDAVIEYDPAGAHIDEMPLEFFYGDAVCLDVSHVRHPDWLTRDVLEAALSSSGLEIRRGDIVCLYTGTGERLYPDPAYLKTYPGLTREGAVWLAEQGVVNIAIDQVSIDHSDDLEYAGHMVCAEYGIVNTENLTNLDQLVSQRFMFMGLPLPFDRGTGSPIRAVALVQD
jgi:kynurenine formamidase